MKSHERWWQDNLPARSEEFAGWLLNSDFSSRRAIGALGQSLHSGNDRERVKVLECGPGVYHDALTVWDHLEYVAYRAIDVTPRIVDLGLSHGYPVYEGSIEDIPFLRDEFDLVYCRHVLEHLPSYRQALWEMCRVAKRKAAAILWRLDTEAEEDVILYNTVRDVPDTYHNMYSQKAISRYLDSHGIEHEWQKCQADWLLVMTPIGARG